tara:strand:- start:7365 stop:7517 length:153 start_codon:yes stop_codon:yes gene_type:complete
MDGVLVITHFTMIFTHMDGGAELCLLAIATDIRLPVHITITYMETSLIEI